MSSRRHVWENHRSANQWKLVRGKSLHCTVMRAYTTWCVRAISLPPLVCEKSKLVCVCGARKRVLASRVVLAALREAPCADNIHRPRTQHASLEETRDPPHERHSTVCPNGAMSRRKSCVPASADLSPHVVRQCTFFARTQVVWTELMRLWETHTSPVTCVLRAAMHRCSSKLPQNDLYFEFKAFLSRRGATR